MEPSLTDSGPDDGLGAWIFLSHSHRDLFKVRRIRDALERLGHQPLMFFLKCVDDDSELADLIRREIAARRWFILCDSPNARRSRWVQEERELIESLDDTHYEVIDLEGEYEEQVAKLEGLSRRLTVFLSFIEGDRATAEAIRAELTAHDFKVREDHQSIALAVRQGFVLVLVGPSTRGEERVLREVVQAHHEQIAIGRSASIIPIYVGSADDEVDVPTSLVRIKGMDFRSGDLSVNLAGLIRFLKRADLT